MPRLRKRDPLEGGLKLDLNRLIRRGIAVSGAVTSRNVCWEIAGSSKLVAVAKVTADLTDWACPRLRIQMGNLDQTIELIAQRRRFGGVQWYFKCPVLGVRASVLWKPDAEGFCSRQALGEKFAYKTQFCGKAKRARIGKERIESLLSNEQAIDWQSLPLKPKWMRWATYDRAIERYSAYEQVLLNGMEVLNARLSAKLA
jgi:hypothetical protein